MVNGKSLFPVVLRGLAQLIDRDPEISAPAIDVMGGIFWDAHSKAEAAYSLRLLPEVAS